jgi:signal transduction histidine kinase
MWFVEYGPESGRVIAASGAADWGLGRPVDIADPTIGPLLTGPRTRDLRVAALAGALADQLSARGLTRMLVARAQVRGPVVGTLHAYFAGVDDRRSVEQRALLAYLASGAAHLSDRAERSVPDDRPVVGVGRYPDDHDRDLFVAVTSHELRTPVTVIKGYADTLSNHWDALTEPDRRQAARVIGQRAGELARLIERLLSAAEHAGPPGGSPPTPFDLAETLRTAVAELPAALRHRLVVDLPEQLPTAQGDRISLVTVLTELATNADKYSAAGTPVRLTAAADEDTVFFRVSDRGVGISPEDAERAFDRFWQGPSGDRRRFAGAGLGLYLVRRIVERQNGWVSLRPAEGGGTVAEVRLPRG